MSEDKQLSALGAEMVAGLRAFCDELETGEPLEKRFTIRSARLDLQPRVYGPEDVKHVRKQLNASQALLARFLGVSVKTLRSWEQGTRPIPSIACRYLDDILAYPNIWTDRMQPATQ